MKRGMIAAVSALCLAFLAVSLIAAQSSYPLDDTFDTNASGWTPTTYQLPDGSYGSLATITWMASKDLTQLYPPLITQAQGVIQVNRHVSDTYPTIHKTVNLQPGAYQVVFRAGSEIDNNELWIRLMGGVTNPGKYIDVPWISNQWYENTSDVFSVVAPGPVTLVFAGLNTFYLDYVRIVPYAGTTPTPYATLARTPIPTAYQATPMPAPTQFCQEPATPAGPASFDVTPTATPDTSGDWQFTDTFSAGSLSSTDWETSNAGATVNADMTGPDNAAGILEMPYASGPAIIHFHSITPTIYVDGWAMANALPIGTSAVVHVMLWDGPSYGWVAAGTENFGAGQWYPFHITVTDPGLHSLPSTAVAIYVSGPSGDKAYLDNIYIYNSLRGAPICGFTENPKTGDETYVVYPADKPCPADAGGSGIQDVPNNFWGPLFFWMSVQFLNITAPFPMHDLFSFAVAIEEFSNSPVWRYVQFGAMLLDLRPIFAVAGLLITLEIIRLIYSIWRLILKIIPMFG